MTDEETEAHKAEPAKVTKLLSSRAQIQPRKYEIEPIFYKGRKPFSQRKPIHGILYRSVPSP